MRIDTKELARRLNSDKNISNLVKRSAPVPSGSMSQKEADNDSRSVTIDADKTEPSLFEPLNPGPRQHVTHETIDHGHRRGCPNIPEPVREVIGALGELNSYKSISQVFDVSIPAVQQAVSGKVGGRPANKERQDAVIARRLSIEDVALAKLMKSLDLIDDEKMEGCSAKELSQVSSNLAKVSQSMRETNTSIGQQTNIVVYSPERRAEDKYNVVDV